MVLGEVRERDTERSSGTPPIVDCLRRKDYGQLPRDAGCGGALPPLSQRGPLLARVGSRDNFFHNEEA